MSSITSYTSFDYLPVTAVPVIASFDSEGHIKPLYVRIGEYSCRVHSFWIKNTFSNITEFNCQIEDNGHLKPVLLTFYQRECVWTIPKK